MTTNHTDSREVGACNSSDITPFAYMRVNVSDTQGQRWVLCGAKESGAFPIFNERAIQAALAQSAKAEPVGVTPAEAFELGFKFSVALVGGMAGETRQIARIMTADFWPDGFSDCARGIDYTDTAEKAIVHVKHNILEKLTAQQPQACKVPDGMSSVPESIIRVKLREVLQGMRSYSDESQIDYTSLVNTIFELTQLASPPTKESSALKSLTQMVNVIEALFPVKEDIPLVMYKALHDAKIVIDAGSFNREIKHDALL